MQLCIVDGVKTCSTCSTLFTLLRADVTANPTPAHVGLPGNTRGRERAGRSASANRTTCRTTGLKTTRNNPQQHYGGCRERRPQHPDSIPEVGEDAVTSVTPSAPPLPPAMTEEERQELHEELVKVEDEIQTLSQVLAAKEKQLAEIKRKLGITPLNEFRQNFTKTWQEVTGSTAYKRTSETLSQASVKATAAFSNMGSAISKKLEDVRNAPSFKSFEEKVGTFKTKMGTSAPAPANTTDQNSDTPNAESSPQDTPAPEPPMN